MLSYFGRHWRGEHSLIRSFWVNGIVGYVLLSVFISIVFAIATSSTQRTPPVAVGASMGLLVIAFTIWLTVGQWRSAQQHMAHTGRKFSARVVQILAVFSWLSLGLQFFSAM